MDIFFQVHCSQTGRKFRSKMRAEHMEILQSPWLIELGAFYMNFIETSIGSSSGQSCPFSCNFSSEEPVMKLTIPGMVKLEYNLTCPICLVRCLIWEENRHNISSVVLTLSNMVLLISLVQDIVFNAYALSCGHLFCKQCVCSAASVLIFQGPKAASPESKCPVCREVSNGFLFFYYWILFYFVKKGSFGQILIIFSLVNGKNWKKWLRLWMIKILELKISPNFVRIIWMCLAFMMYFIIFSL